MSGIEMQEKVREVIYRDPAFTLFHEYRQRNPDATRMEIRSVEDAIAEKACWALSLSCGPQAFETGSGSELDNALFCLSSLVLLKAVPYVWSNEMFSIVGSSELPRHTIETQLPFEAIWFTFPNRLPVDYHETPRPPFKRFVDGFLAVQIPGAIRLVGLGGNDDTNKLLFNGVDIRQGSIFPDSFNNARRQFVAPFLSCISFINSPYIVLDKRGLRRQQRRRLGIEKIEDRNVARFILLRSPLRKSDEKHRETDIDWKFKWMVRGHHRAQWLPSTRTHRLMWIAPYIKGPEDAPMKTRAYKVIQ